MYLYFSDGISRRKNSFIFMSSPFSLFLDKKGVEIRLFSGGSEFMATFLLHFCPEWQIFTLSLSRNCDNFCQNLKTAKFTFWQLPSSVQKAHKCEISFSMNLMYTVSRVLRHIPSLFSNLFISLLITHTPRHLSCHSLTCQIAISFYLLLRDFIYKTVMQGVRSFTSAQKKKVLPRFFLLCVFTSFLWFYLSNIIHNVMCVPFLHIKNSLYEFSPIVCDWTIGRMLWCERWQPMELFVKGLKNIKHENVNKMFEWKLQKIAGIFSFLVLFAHGSVTNISRQNMIVTVLCEPTNNGHEGHCTITKAATARKNLLFCPTFLRFQLFQCFWGRKRKRKICTNCNSVHRIVYVTNRTLYLSLSPSRSIFLYFSLRKVDVKLRS